MFSFYPQRQPKGTTLAGLRKAHSRKPSLPLPLTIDAVLPGRRRAARLFAGHITSGQVFLIAPLPCRRPARRWLCAETSRVAIDCVISGRANPADVFRHSSSGTVEDITVHSDGRVTESVHLCADFNASLFLSHRRRTRLSTRR